MPRKPGSPDGWWATFVEPDPSPDADAVRNFKRAVANALRSDPPLPLWARRLIADEAQRRWLDTPGQKRKAIRQAKARGIEFTIDELAREHSMSKAEAKERVVAMPKFKLKSVEALDRFLLRVRRERKRADKG